MVPTLQIKLVNNLEELRRPPNCHCDADDSSNGMWSEQVGARGRWCRTFVQDTFVHDCAVDKRWRCRCCCFRVLPLSCLLLWWFLAAIYVPKLTVKNSEKTIIFQRSVTVKYVDKNANVSPWDWKHLFVLLLLPISLNCPLTTTTIIELRWACSVQSCRALVRVWYQNAMPIRCTKFISPLASGYYISCSRDVH